MSLTRSLLTNPALLLQHRNIFLLSHMRANTSLFGHLLGSHPEIEGYYEMHIGYYSWRSLWRQKLRHFADHDAKPGARFMFDKVLHDGHEVAPDLLRRPTSHVVMMIRTPDQSIRSLVALYRKDSPHLPEAQPEGATRYYVERLATLSRLATALGPRYLFLDAECLVERTEGTLEQLGDWLGLTTPIGSEYQTFSKTGRGKAGDNSARLSSGKVSRSGQDYSHIEVPLHCQAEARDAYERHRAALLDGCARRIERSLAGEAA